MQIPQYLVKDIVETFFKEPRTCLFCKEVITLEHLEVGNVIISHVPDIEPVMMHLSHLYTDQGKTEAPTYAEAYKVLIDAMNDQHLLKSTSAEIQA